LSDKPTTAIVVVVRKRVVSWASVGGRGMLGTLAVPRQQAEL
jgi:hypothetical protein